MLKTAVAIRHVGFEDLGLFESVLQAAGYKVHYYEAGIDPLWTLEPVKTELLVVLGGPVGVYDSRTYPVLAEEIDLLAQRIAAGRPTFGICLGAQLMAAALGARVAPTGTREIGFAPLDLTDAGRAGPLAALEGVSVLHWHGDMFDIPVGAVRLAATAACPNQAFALGPNVMGVQFHPETDAARLESWLIGHAVELAAAGIDPRDLRAQALAAGPALRAAGSAMFAAWLAGLRP